ncbi:MAG: hypothetical protein OEY23_20925, partial [Acidimicrobiia bacterium]|nr:hypothetical protein [Acidimicrobiia bacterium]
MRRSSNPKLGNTIAVLRRSPAAVLAIAVATMLVASATVLVRDRIAQGAAVEISPVAASYEAGAYIVDMGVTPQTFANGLKPYGFVYDMIVNAQLPVLWAFDGDKAKDGVDFTVGSKTYRGGAFIVAEEFAQDAAPYVAYWRSQGVVIDGPIAERFEAPEFAEITAWPNAVLDEQNGKITAGYYVNAGIPRASTDPAPYRIGLPSDLNDCDDLYVMPHADPEWETHENLIPFNEQGGFIWAACHAVSVLENVADPADPNPDPEMNFLTRTGAIDFGDHDGPTPPYTYATSKGGDPIMQFLGSLDQAVQNGSEQIYLPAADGGWRPETEVLAWDADHPEVPSASPGEATILAYGRGFGDPANGLVMYEAGHSHNKGSDPDNVAAQRAFFNLHLLAGIERGLDVTTNVPDGVKPGQTVQVSGSASGGSGIYTYEWKSSCGGTFADPTSPSTTFTAPNVGSATPCSLRLVVNDTCERSAFSAEGVFVAPETDLEITKADSEDPVESGATFSYTLDVSNNGPGGATRVVVEDQLPPEVSFESATASQGSCTLVGDTVRCELGSLNFPASAQVTITVRAANDARGTITNTATVSSREPDRAPANNTAAEDTTVGKHGLTITKSASPEAIASPPADVTYTYEVTNTDPTPLSDVEVTDDTCPDVSYDSGDANGDDVLQQGEVWIFTCSQRIGADTTNTAFATATHPELGPVRSKDATAFVNVISPGVAIEKAPDTQQVPQGGDATFQITVTNTGDTDLADVTVADPAAPGCDRTFALIAAGASRTYSCSLAVLGGSGTTGTNTATVTAADPAGGPDLTASDTADYEVVPSNLRISKIADTTIAEPGDQVSFTIEAENISSVPQTNLQIDDALPAGMTFVSAVIDTEASVSEDWSGDSEGDLYVNGWLESEEAGNDPPAKRYGGDVRIANIDAGGGTGDGCRVDSDENCVVKIAKGEVIWQPIDLSDADSVTVDVSWRAKDPTKQSDFAVVGWNGSAWVTLQSVTAEVGVLTPISLTSTDPSIMIAGGRIGFLSDPDLVGNDNEVYLDDITITWTGGSLSEDWSGDSEGDLYVNGWLESEEAGNDPPAKRY